MKRYTRPIIDVEDIELKDIILESGDVNGSKLPDEEFVPNAIFTPKL